MKYGLCISQWPIQKFATKMVHEIGLEKYNDFCYAILPLGYDTMQS